MLVPTPDTPCAWREAAPKRRQIIDGAAIVFNELGYDGASMSRIAEEAAVSKGTLYNYFTSKSDLFSAFVEREANERRAWIFSTDAVAPGLSNATIEDLLKGIARRLIHVLLSPPAQKMFRIIISEATKFPELARIYHEVGHQRGCEEMASWLSVQAAAGRLSIADPVMAADQFAALCRTRLWVRTMMKLHDPADETEIETIVESTIAMFLNTYGRRTDHMTEQGHPT